MPKTRLLSMRRFWDKKVFDDFAQPACAFDDGIQPTLGIVQNLI